MSTTSTKNNSSKTMIQLQKLARKNHITAVSHQEMLNRIPDDWKKGEFDVDEFLCDISVRKQLPR